MNESHEEQSYGDPYYDLRIDRLQTMTHVEERPSGGTNGMSHWLAGCWYDLAELANLNDELWLAKHDDAELYLCVEDNGAGGDGLWLHVSIGGDRNIAGIRLSPRQAQALVSALQAALKMRKPEEPQP